MLDAVARHAARERIRTEQQGLGKPIIAFKNNDHQIVAVGKTVYFSPKWKTFADFLADYVGGIFGPEWAAAELEKPLQERHTLMQWHHALCEYQRATIVTPGVPSLAPVTGIVACYLGLAYSLYLLAHNVELQARLVKRLKNAGNFQGAYYETIVANILLRAGFELTLEDESDAASKHCEFAARSRRTGKTYWVEAKMRSVVGQFGKTAADSTTSTNPLSQLIPHLNGALQKPAHDERLIFIDLNADPKSDSGAQPIWVARAARRLERFETRELAEGERAFVFVTNFAFHRTLDKPPYMAAFPFGVGILDFNRPGMRRPSEAYRLKQKYIDVHDIGDAINKYLRLPPTFDGSLISDKIDGTMPRPVIGNTYCFGDPAIDGVVGEVTGVSVDELTSEALVAIKDTEGRTHIFREKMSPEQMADYRNHRDSYFGRIVPVGGKLNSPYELFEWLLENHKATPRKKLLDALRHLPNAEARDALSDTDLLYEYCDLMVASMWNLPGSQPQKLRA